MFFNVLNEAFVLQTKSHLKGLMFVCLDFLFFFFFLTPNLFPVEIKCKTGLLWHDFKINILYQYINSGE